MSKHAHLPCKMLTHFSNFLAAWLKLHFYNTSRPKCHIFLAAPAKAAMSSWAGPTVAKPAGGVTAGRPGLHDLHYVRVDLHFGGGGSSGAAAGC